MISNKNRLIQVKVSRTVYDYLKKYSDFFNVSISHFCEIAIIDRIIKHGGFKDEEK